MPNRDKCFDVCKPIFNIVLCLLQLGSDGQEVMATEAPVTIQTQVIRA